MLLYSALTLWAVFSNRLCSFSHSMNASAQFLPKVMILLKASELASERNKRKKENCTENPSVRVKIS